MERNGSNKNGSRMVVFPLLFGFFVMGFVDVVGIATNYVKQDFGLSDTMSNLIPMMVFLWFAICSIPTGLLMNRAGKRRTVSVALAVTIVGLLIPMAAYSFAAVLGGFALLGIGNTMLQVALNPMVATVVAPQRTASILTLGQFLKAVSSFFGPLIAAGMSAWWGDWRYIFAVYAATTVVSLVWLLLSVPGDRGGERRGTGFREVCSLFGDSVIRMLFLGILVIVGIDVGLNTMIPRLLMERLDLPLSEAGLGTSLYFSARTVGAFAGAFLLARWALARFLRYSMVASIGAFALLLSIHNLYGMGAMIVVVGLGCANVFSILFAYALRRMPERDNEISALMIMGVSGGALVTPLMGVLSDMFGLTEGLSLLALCMAYLWFIGRQVGQTDKKQIK